MDETINNQHSPEALWFNILREKWSDCFWDDSSALKKFADHLGLAVVPISIMPFREGEIYAKYIDHLATTGSVACSCSNQSIEVSSSRVIECFTLRLMSVEKALDEKEKSPNNSCAHYSCVNIRPAPGLWNSLIATNPTVWFPYADSKMGIDPFFATQVESKLFADVLGKHDGYTRKATEEEIGQYMLPLFFGTVPVYVLVVMSQKIDPEFFTRRFLESLFDSMTEIGETILKEHFEDIWQKYAKELARSEKSIDENAVSFFQEIWNKANTHTCYSWVHSLPGHSLKSNVKRTKQVNLFASDFITKNAVFWVPSRKDMLGVFQSNAKEGLAFSRDDDHDCDGVNGAQTREDAKNKIEKSEWGRVLWVKEKVLGWVDGVPTVNQCQELKAVLLPYDTNRNGRMSLALIKAWKEICWEYKDINLALSGQPEKHVPIGNIDPYKLVDSIFWLLRNIGNNECVHAEQKDEDGTPHITITLKNVPKNIKLKCESDNDYEDEGQCCDAYKAIVDLIPVEQFVVYNIIEETFDVKITL